MTTTLPSAADLYPRVAHVIPSVEWATMSDDVDAILRLKRERNAVILAHNYMTPDIFRLVGDFRGDRRRRSSTASPTSSGTPSPWPARPSRWTRT